MEIFGFKKGVFTLWEVNKQTNTKTKLVHDDNVIVNNSWNIISGLLSNTPNKYISSLALGDGGIQNSILQTPTINDTALFNEIYRDNTIQTTVIESIVKPYYITFKFSIGEMVANNGAAQIYSEAGLFSADGTMFSRKTFHEVLKTPEKKFLIDWKLVYAI